MEYLVCGLMCLCFVWIFFCLTRTCHEVVKTRQRLDVMCLLVEELVKEKRAREEEKRRDKEIVKRVEENIRTQQSFYRR